jgi:hypothetical protein
LYFRSEDDRSTGGDLELYRYKPNLASFNLNTFQLESGDFEISKIVPYRPNQLVFWINSLNSLHGVSPRGLTAAPRRYINLIGETYRYAADGLYTPPGKMPSLLARLTRRIGLPMFR